MSKTIPLLCNSACIFNKGSVEDCVVADIDAVCKLSSSEMETEVELEVEVELNWVGSLDEDRTTDREGEDCCTVGLNCEIFKRIAKFSKTIAIKLK